MDGDLDSKKRRSTGVDQGYDDAKRTKSENPPSRVLHIRNIPPDATESEVLDISAPFGAVDHVLHMRTKLQALVQFEQESFATTMVNYYAYVTPVIRNQPIYIQYSTHKELKVAEKHNQPPQQQPHFARDRSPSPERISDPYRDAKPKVLRVAVDHMLYPVTIEVLQQLFTKYGTVQKIVIFTKNEQFQALVQYQYANDAKTGKDMLDGQNIYNGCNTLRIDFSKLSELTVKGNTSRSWDFTKPNLPLESPGLPMGGAGVLPLPFGAGQLPALLGNGRPPPMQGFHGGPPGPRHQGPPRQGDVLLVSNLVEGAIMAMCYA